MTQSLTTRPTTHRRTGYVFGALADVLLLVLIHVWPGWDVVPFLTGDMTQVLGWIDAALIAGIVVSAAHLVRDPGWLTPAGTLVTTAFGLAAMVRLLQVFPFDLSSGWATAVRVLLIVGVIGSAIGLLAALVSLVRMLAVARR